MKKLFLLFSLCFLMATVVTSTGCQRGTGCPASDAASVRTDRKGKLSTKRGSSNLFPKHMRRKNR
ncbi:hypothetical protein [Flavilitoribacter nigricans]|uniref:hypothetical protein n=1 Tax=Flavilitoribacter nigricans TaxID=70997 RepID=UPI00117B6F68|nr:hypothetical protein [Flavilitoribacter nigricans]